MSTPSDTHGASLAHESSEPNTRLLWVFILATLAFLVLVHLAGHYGFHGIKDTEIIRKQGLAGPVRELRLLRLEAQEQMNSYGWVDKEAGRVRIPVQRAMELVVAEAASGAGAGHGGASAGKIAARNPAFTGAGAAAAAASPSGAGSGKAPSSQASEGSAAQ